MNRSHFSVLAILLISVCCTSSFATSYEHPPRTQNSSAAPNKPISAEEITESTKEEIAVLHARLDAEREHNSAVLQTVYWSLGMLATIAAALIGFGWLANFRIYERDRQDLISTLANGLEKGATDATLAITAATENLKNNINESTELIRTQNSESISQAVKTELASLLAQISLIEKSSKQFQIEHELLKAEFLFDKDQNGNAFSSLLRAIMLAKELGNSYLIESMLGNLERQITAMDKMFETDMINISKFLENLDNIPSLQRDRLTELLRKIKKW